METRILKIDEDTIKYFNEKLDYYLNNESERERISKAGNEHLKKYHSCKARAQQFIDGVKKCL